MGAFNSICSCNTNSWTQTQLSLCCNNSLTEFGSCTDPFTTSNLFTSGGKANITFIENLPCFSTTWYNTNNGVITSFNETNFKNSLLAKVTKTYCVQTCFCIIWCSPPVPETAGLYVSIEPLSDFINQIKLIKYSNKNIKIIPYKFDYKNKFCINITDYNLINFKKINYYIEIKDIKIGNYYCSNLEKNINITLKSPFGPTFSSSINIFTTIISNLLINSNLINNQTEYFKILVVYSRKLLKYAYFYFKLTYKLNKNKDVNTYLINYINDNKLGFIKNLTDLYEYFIKYIFKIQYIQQNNISIFFNKYSSIILFIYLIIMTNAQNKFINIDLNFDMCFSKLILKFSKKFYLTTYMVNKTFKNICPNILTDNYDIIFINYINFILNENDESLYIPIKYIPLFYNYEQMKTGKIEELIKKYINPIVFLNNLNNYRNNYNISQINTNLTNINTLPNNIQERIINAFVLKNANRNLYINNNSKKKCNCSNNKIIINK